jgi:hypothetical protein
MPGLMCRINKGAIQQSIPTPAVDEHRASAAQRHLCPVPTPDYDWRSILNRFPGADDRNIIAIRDRVRRESSWSPRLVRAKQHTPLLEVALHQVTSKLGPQGVFLALNMESDLPHSSLTRSPRSYNLIHP